MTTTLGRLAPSAGIRERLFNRGAYQWYLGTIFGLAYQSSEIIFTWTSTSSVGLKVITTIILTVFYVAYVALPPLLWPQSVRARIIALSVYWALTFVLLPFLGVFMIWVWPLVVAMIAFCWLPWLPAILMSVVVVGVQVLIAGVNSFTDGTEFAPVVTVTVALSLLWVTTQITASHRIRDAQATIATLAAADERARLARDLHDVLGHSLTVVAVKSELAGRLVERDPKKAIAEIADIENLARDALADLRAAVTSYRELNLDAELTAARTALEAAGIEAHLPDNANAVDTDLQPLFGWVLREGVTNVIRHSNAKRCWVEVGPRQLRVRDDGAGSPRSSETAIRERGGKNGSGNGLRGLTERAGEVGATLSATRADGGFVLTVQGAAT